MMQGGWSFVGWAYGIAYGGLAIYGLFLWYRIDQENRTPPEPPAPPEDLS